VDIGKILQRAWQIIWKHKVLWIFGIFAGCSSNGFGGNWGNVNTSPSSSADFALPDQITSFFERIFGNLQDWQVFLIIAIAVIVIVLFVLLLSLLFILLGTLGKIGIILGVNWIETANQSSDEGDIKKSITFSNLLRAAFPYVWRLFLLNLLLSIGWLIGVLVGAVLLIVTIVGICFLLPYCCLLIPLGWIFGIYVQQANVALVSENLSLTQALQRGWEVFKTNFGELLVMGFILAVGGTIIGIAIMLPFLFAFVPLLVGSMLGGTDAAMTPGMTSGLIISIVLLLVYLPFFIILNGGLQAYLQTAWTLTYRSLTKR